MPEIVAQVAELLPKALYLETVSDLLGVHRRTMSGWVRRGRLEARRLARVERQGKEPAINPKESLYYEFFLAFKKAMSEGQQTALDVIAKAATDGVWQAGAWLLERRFPEKWSSNRKELRELAKMIEAQGQEIEKLRRQILGSNGYSLYPDSE
jgi:hypothetical protein